MYANYYNKARTHLSLRNDAPISRPLEWYGRIIAEPVVGGLHHRYARIWFSVSTAGSLRLIRRLSHGRAAGGRQGSHAHPQRPGRDAKFRPVAAALAALRVRARGRAGRLTYQSSI